MRLATIKLGFDRPPRVGVALMEKPGESPAAALKGRPTGLFGDRE
ncbi:MAG: hypothetical protein ABL995_08985 [Bryobacteraceae bacterium]